MRYYDYGSSPLTRGKPRREPIDCSHQGLIPAHAGKTGGSASTERTQEAHPRSRGENIASLASLSKRRGSSPLTRGKPQEEIDKMFSNGLIPAHAGKTPHAAT